MKSFLRQKKNPMTSNRRVFNAGRIFTAACLLAEVATVQSFAADISRFADLSADIGYFHVAGLITPADVTKFSDIFSNKSIHSTPNKKGIDVFFPLGLEHKSIPQYDSKKMLTVIRIYSRGGDVNSSIQIGYMIRKIRGVVIIEEGAECLSACVFLLAGATQRHVANSAKVGIHRPYSTSTVPTDYAQAQKTYRELDNIVRKFLSDMNLPTQLFDAMQRIPAEHIHVLSTNELTGFGLNQKDPVEAEIHDAAFARQYGLTKQEYLARKVRASTLCNQYGADFKIFSRCEDDVMRGRK